MKALRVSNTSGRPTISFLANMVTTNYHTLRHLGLEEGETKYGDKYSIVIFIGEEDDEYPLYVGKSDDKEPNSLNGVYEVIVNSHVISINPSSLKEVMRDKNIAKVQLTNDKVSFEGYTLYGCRVISTVSQASKQVGNQAEEK